MARFWSEFEAHKENTIHNTDPTQCYPRCGWPPLQIFTCYHGQVGTGTTLRVVHVTSKAVGWKGQWRGRKNAPKRQEKAITTGCVYLWSPMGKNLDVPARLDYQMAWITVLAGEIPIFGWGNMANLGYLAIIVPSLLSLYVLHGKRLNCIIYIAQLAGFPGNQRCSLATPDTFGGVHGLNKIGGAKSSSSQLSGLLTIVMGGSIPYPKLYSHGCALW